MIDVLFTALIDYNFHCFRQAITEVFDVRFKSPKVSRSMSRTHSNVESVLTNGYGEQPWGYFYVLNINLLMDKYVLIFFSSEIFLSISNYFELIVEKLFMSFLVLRNQQMTWFVLNLSCIWLFVWIVNLKMFFLVW